MLQRPLILDHCFLGVCFSVQAFIGSSLILPLKVVRGHLWRSRQWVGEEPSKIEDVQSEEKEEIEDAPIDDVDDAEEQPAVARSDWSWTFVFDSIIRKMKIKIGYTYVFDPSAPYRWARWRRDGLHWNCTFPRRIAKLPVRAQH